MTTPESEGECRQCPVHLYLQKSEKMSVNLQETIHISGASTSFGRQLGKVDVSVFNLQLQLIVILNYIKVLWIQKYTHA